MIEDVTIIETGIVEDDDDEDIYLRIETKRDEPVECYMQRHEALEVIKALVIALLALEEGD